eukprot:497132-Amphidinium_carterae.1
MDTGAAWVAPNRSRTPNDSQKTSGMPSVFQQETSAQIATVREAPRSPQTLQNPVTLQVWLPRGMHPKRPTVQPSLSLPYRGTLLSSLLQLLVDKHCCCCILVLWFLRDKVDKLLQHSRGSVYSSAQGMAFRKTRQQSVQSSTASSLASAFRPLNWVEELKKSL